MEAAIVLLSGGLDSAVTLALAREKGLNCHALSFSYGQRHAIEVEAARHISAAFGVSSHEVVEIDLRATGGSALTDDIEVPKGSVQAGIPITYVPARNTIFLSYALAYAEVLDGNEIHLGVNAIDYSGYPDCRPEYLKAFEQMANLATKRAVEGSPIRIIAPLLHRTKAEIVKEGVRLGLDFSMTTSCYDPDEDGSPCKRCDSCQLRARGFEEAGVQDPRVG